MRKKPVLIVDSCLLEQAAAELLLGKKFKIHTVALHAHLAVKHAFETNHDGIVLITGREPHESRDHFEEARLAAEWITEHSNALVGVIDPKRSNITVYHKGRKPKDIAVSKMMRVVDNGLIARIVVHKNPHSSTVGHLLQDLFSTGKKPTVKNWETIIEVVLASVGK